MALIRSFTGYSPPARFDDEPFTQVVVQEAPAATGPWTTIQTIPISPVDSDPAVPQSRSFTTTAATLERAWYRLIWSDAAAGTYTSDAVYFSTSSDEFITLQDVARILGVSEIANEEQANVRAAIDIAIAWAKKFLRDENLGGNTEGATYTFYDTRGDVLIPNGATPVEVRVMAYRAGTLRTLPESDWYFDGNAVRFVGPGDLGLPDDETLSDTLWHRVEVDTEMESNLAVRSYGVALAAASVYTRGTRVGSGVKSESLGDYSYTLAEADASGDPFFAEAKSVLRPFRRRGPIMVP